MSKNANKTVTRQIRALDSSLALLSEHNQHQSEIIREYPGLTADVCPLDYNPKHQNINPAHPLPAAIMAKTQEYQTAYRALIRVIDQRTRLWKQMRNTIRAMPFADVPQLFLQKGLCAHGLPNWTSYYEFETPLALTAAEQRLSTAGSPFFRTNIGLIMRLKHGAA